MCFYYLDFNFNIWLQTRKITRTFETWDPSPLVTTPSIYLTLFRSESEFHTPFQMDILYPRKCTVIHDTWWTISLSHMTWPSRMQIASLFWLRLKIDHYRKYHSTQWCPLSVTPQFCISIVFSLSWGHFNSQEKLKTILVQNFGMLCYGML